MAQRSIPSRTPAQAIKVFISTAAVAATLSGWALLAAQNRTAALQSDPLLSTLPAETVQPTITAPPPAWLMAPPPIPTLQPLIAVVQPPAPPAPEAVVVNPAPPAPEAVVVNPAPPVSANPPALREVNAPVTVSQPEQRPVPVVTTRSSR